MDLVEVGGRNCFQAQNILESFSHLRDGTFVEEVKKHRYSTLSLQLQDLHLIQSRQFMDQRMSLVCLRQSVRIRKNWRAMEHCFNQSSSALSSPERHQKLSCKKKAAHGEQIITLFFSKISLYYFIPTLRFSISITSTIIDNGNLYIWCSAAPTEQVLIWLKI